MNSIQMARRAQTFSRRRAYARRHRTTARVLLVGIAVQFFFAGLGVFGIADFMAHAVMGGVVIAASFSLPIMALIGRLSASIIWRSILLAVLMVVQGLLIDLGSLVHVLWAFHPVNALALGLLTFSLANSRTAEAASFAMPPTPIGTTQVGNSAEAVSLVR